MNGAPKRSVRILERELFAPQWDDDFLAAPPLQDDAAILDRLERDLVSMSAQLQTELLAFFHDPAVDDGEARSALEGDGGKRKGRDRNIRAAGVVLGSCARDPGGWDPTDGPKRIAAGDLEFEERLVFSLDGRGTGGGMQPPESQQDWN